MQAVGSSSLRRESLAALGAVGALSAGAVAVNVRSSLQASGQRWYKRLRMPPYMPPAQVFRPVWGVLYTLQALSGWRVWNAPGGLLRSRALQLWVAQLAFSTAWSWLFLSRRRAGAALVDQLALGVSLTAYLRAARKVDSTAAWLVVPYLAWVGFGTLLYEELLRRNRGRLPRPLPLSSR